MVFITKSNTLSNFLSFQSTVPRHLTKVPTTLVQLATTFSHINTTTPTPCTTPVHDLSRELIFTHQVPPLTLMVQPSRLENMAATYIAQGIPMPSQTHTPPPILQQAKYHGGTTSTYSNCARQHPTHVDLE